MVEIEMFRDLIKQKLTPAQAILVKNSGLNHTGPFNAKRSFTQNNAVMGQRKMGQQVIVLQFINILSKDNLNNYMQYEIDFFP